MYIIIPVNAFTKEVQLDKVVHAKDEYQVRTELVKLCGQDIANDTDLRDVGKEIPSWDLAPWLDRYNRFVQRRAFGVIVHMVKLEVTL